jgi:hypothetical protein
MPDRENVSIDVRDITLRDAADEPVPLGSLAGVQLLVLLRHRH